MSYLPHNSKTKNIKISSENKNKLMTMMMKKKNNLETNAKKPSHLKRK